MKNQIRKLMKCTVREFVQFDVENWKIAELCQKTLIFG